MKKQSTRGYGILEDFLSKKRFELARSIIFGEGKSTILDIGCGTYPSFLSSLDLKEKFGIDKMLEYNRTIDGIILKKYDLEKDKKINLKDNYFDVVTILAVIEHIDNKSANFLIKEVFRILKEDGLVIITTPRPFANNLLKIGTYLNLVSKEEIAEHKCLYTKENLITLLVNNGFDEKNIRYGYFDIFMNIWLTAKK